MPSNVLVEHQMICLRQESLKNKQTNERVIYEFSAAFPVSTSQVASNVKQNSKLIFLRSESHQ